MSVKRIEKIDRRTWEGFDKYFSLRPFHFFDLYGMEYTKDNCRTAYVDTIYIVEGRSIPWQVM